MNILSIGNSFSQDAQRYLHGVAEAGGDDFDVFNLYIGGCSLERHYRNMLGNFREYTLEMNGESTGFHVSLSEALLNRDWDIVTLQQVSSCSNKYDLYVPYLAQLAAYVRKCLPKTKIAIHQTWAYEDDSTVLTEKMKYKKHVDMYNDVKNAYLSAYDEVKADYLIPSGELFKKMLENGISKVHRDNAHASFGNGRYALALLWYSTLGGKDVSNNDFSRTDEPIDNRDMEIIKKCVAETVAMYESFNNLNAAPASEAAGSGSDFRWES